MMWQKGDLVYIPSRAKLAKLNWDSLDCDENGEPYSLTMNTQQPLEKPSFGIVLDHVEVMDMRKLFIANVGYWYVSNRDIYEPRRSDDKIQRSSTGDRDAG